MTVSDKHFQHALDTLQYRRNELVEEINKIDNAISAMREVIREPSPIREDPVKVAELGRKYAKVSVRGAILQIINSFMGSPLKIPFITERLIEGGNKHATKGGVSANISSMLKKGEVSVHPEIGGYVLTEIGERALRKFQNKAKYQDEI